MSVFFTHLTIIVALAVAACGVLTPDVPSLDSAASQAMQSGGCVKIVEARDELACNMALWSDAPIRNCRAAVARCARW